MSESITVAFNDQPVIVDSVFGFNDQVLEEVERNITSFEFVDSDDLPISTPIVSLQESSHTSVQIVPGSNDIDITGSREEFGQGRSLLYVAEYLAISIQSSRDGIFLVHGAATYNPDNESSLLILGEKGAGKTTLSIKLCRDLGHLLIGNDQVYFGGMDSDKLRTYSGNTWFNVRNTAIDSDSYIAELIEKKPKKDDVPAWNTKQRVEPESIGIGVFKGAAPISEIIHVRIDPTQTEAHSAEWMGVQRNLIVHERIGRHVLGQATPFQTDDGEYIGSLPLVKPEASLAMRDRVVKAVINKGITEIFVANSAQAVEYIKENSR